MDWKNKALDGDSEMIVKYLELDSEHKEIREELLSAAGRVLDSGVFILGGEVRKFEGNLARLVGAKHAIGMNSGTDALMLSMRALGIGPGGEVIVPANSFLASASTVALLGATPVFCDVKENYLIDEEKIEGLATKKTKAVMPVHLTGRPCNMEKVMKIANRLGIHVIEDCAQAVGAKWNGKGVGTFGVCGCFSLHPLKNLSACGDGGAVVTNDDSLCEKLIQMRNIGLKNRNEADILGYNSRLDALQAALLNVKLRHLDENTRKRRENAKLYRELLSKMKIPGVKYIPSDAREEFAVYHTFILQVEKRDELVEFLAKNGIETKIHYPIPIHMQKCFSYLPKVRVGNVEAQAGSIITLPVHKNLKRGQIEYVCKKIGEFYSGK